MCYPQVFVLQLISQKQGPMTKCIQNGIQVLVNQHLYKAFTREQSSSSLPFHFFVFALVLTQEGEVVELLGHIRVIRAENLLPELNRYEEVQDSPESVFAK